MGNADTSLPKGKREGSIRNRLILLLLIVLLPVLVMEGVVFYHRYETRLTEEFQSNLEIARAFGKSFESFYQNLIRAELIVGLALTADPSLELQDQNRILDAFQADYPSIRSLFWINKQGIIVASSLRSYIGFDISDRSFYREVIAGRDWHVSELVIGKATGKPAFTISRGIRNQKGELLGIVAASIEPDSLDTALSLYRSSDAGVSLIDHRGMNVYRYPAFNYTWEQRNWLKRYPLMEDSLRGREVTGRVTSDYSGKTRLVAFVPVYGIGWVAAASRAEADVVSDILSTLLFQSGLFLVIALAGFGSAVLFSRPLSKSITRLRDYAVALGRGEQVTIEAPAGPVEIREVYDEFNTMKEDVKRREAELRSEISERKQAEEAADIAHRQVQSIIDNTTALIYAFDLEGRFVMANTALAELLNSTPEQMIGKRRHEFMPKDDADWHEANDRKAVEAGGALEFEEYSQLKGRSITWLTTKFPLRDAQGRIYAVAGISADVSERKQAEARLRNDLSALVRMHELSGRLLGADGHQLLLQEVMDTAVSILGAERGTLQLLEGDSLRIVAHHGHKPPFLEFIASAENRASVCGQAMLCGDRVLVPDIENSTLFAGTPSLPILREAGVRAVQSTPLVSRTGEILGILTTQWGTPYSPDEHDLRRIDLLARQAADLIELAGKTEALERSKEQLEDRVRERTLDLQNLTEQLEKSRHELRKLASELVMAEQRERKRISEVLHDDIAQILAAIRMRLDLLQSMPSGDKDQQTLKEAKAFLLQSIQETRALMNELGNPLLFDLGLKSACEALADRLMGTNPIQIKCDIRDTYQTLNADMKILLYQVVRELLNNVVKHSKAKTAHIMIDKENEHFKVKVTDDGIGFDTLKLGMPTVEGGYGLYSIRERLMAIDGSLSIDSTPETGTVATAILPASLD